jgi:hypothetical protein
MLEMQKGAARALLLLRWITELLKVPLAYVY